MITLHRIGHPEEPFQLNPDSIVTIESTPDTVVTLATQGKVVVGETPEQVADAMRRWRVDVLAGAMQAKRPQGTPLRSVDVRPLRAVAAPRCSVRIEGLPRTADHRGR
jgi:uncharacterized protein YlzI (FlbEa/FlbD family)